MRKKLSVIAYPSCSYIHNLKLEFFRSDNFIIFRQFHTVAPAEFRLPGTTYLYINYLLCYPEGKPKPTPFTDMTIHPDMPALGFYKFLGNG